jgi:hypothetical protein
MRPWKILYKKPINIMSQWFLALTLSLYTLAAGLPLSRIRMTEEFYDIFRGIFHNEEDALAATIQLFRGDPISWDEDYGI